MVRLCFRSAPAPMQEMLMDTGFVDVLEIVAEALLL